MELVLVLAVPVQVLALQRLDTVAAAVALLVVHLLLVLGSKALLLFGTSQTRKVKKWHTTTHTRHS